MTGPHLEITDLSVRYGHREAVSGVTLRLGQGVTTLVGANGAGKSSLLRSIAGLQEPARGTVTWGEESPARPCAWQRLAGYLPQEPDLAGGVSVADTVALAGWLKGLDGRELRAAVAAALDPVGLADRARDRVRTLSGGMRRRLGFATAVVHRPRLLLLDEPTAGLDPEQRGALGALVADLATVRVVVTSTHVLDDLRRTGGRVAIVADGRVTFHGTTRELADRAGRRLGRFLDPERAGDLDLAYLDAGAG